MTESALQRAGRPNEAKPQRGGPRGAVSGRPDLTFRGGHFWATLGDFHKFDFAYIVALLAHAF